MNENQVNEILKDLKTGGEFLLNVVYNPTDFEKVMKDHLEMIDSFQGEILDNYLFKNGHFKYIAVIETKITKTLYTYKVISGGRKVKRNFLGGF